MARLAKHCVFLLGVSCIFGLYWVTSEINIKIPYKRAYRFLVDIRNRYENLCPRINGVDNPVFFVTGFAFFCYRIFTVADGRKTCHGPSEARFLYKKVFPGTDVVD